MDYIDFLTSIVQSILFVYITNYCLEYKTVIKIKLIVCVILLTCIGYFVPNLLGNLSICIFITHILALILVVLFFYKKAFEALLAYNLIYTLMLIWIFVCRNIAYGLLDENISSGNNIINILLLNIFQVILVILCIKNADKIKQIYKILLFENTSKYYIVMTTFIPDFLVSYSMSSYNDEDPILITIITGLLIVFLIFSIIYWIKVKDRADKIYKLNETLEIKNSELKEIKNSYGMQMSSLYELCMMEQYDNVKNFLKSIINVQGNSNESASNMNNDSLLAYATRHVQSQDIKITVNDTANLKLLPMSELELYRIVVNIVNNAVKAMKGKGTLTISSYNKLENVFIEIENDGEKIPEEYIDKIFQAGFTTKKDMDKNHGYGLNIVKELIENCNGRIFVDSNEVRTKFTIKLPMEKMEDSIII